MTDSNPRGYGIHWFLASVRRIVERHGGNVWAQGSPQQGGAFYVSLPR